MGMAAFAASTSCCFSTSSIKTFQFRSPTTCLSFSKSNFFSISSLSSPIPRLPSNNFGLFKRLNRVFCNSVSTISTNTTHYEFSDGSSEVELRLELGGQGIQSSRDIRVDAEETSLAIRVQNSESLKILMETTCLYDKIKPGETIWYIDDDQLVVNLKKQEPDLKWPDIMESWESLTVGVMQLLKGASINLVGDSTEINQKIARELAVGLGYTPLNTKELLEAFAKQTIDSWVIAEGSDSVAEAESAVLESLSRIYCMAVTI